MMTCVSLPADFWKYGHELFKSSPDSFPAGFVAGDAFSHEIIRPCHPFYADPLTTRPENLQNLESLTPLQGHISVIHASSLFHLFNEEKQETLARRFASLLSPQPGSVIFGSHGCLPEKGTRYDLIPNHPLFCHGPESWKALWDGQVFKKGSVRVDVGVKLVKRSRVQLFNENKNTKFYLLTWSVTRL
jgi:hypothetical protein